MRWTLLSRAYCHLCDDMREALMRIPGMAEQLCLVDVDAHPELERRYGELVPVLLADDVVVCHYHFDHAAFARYLPVGQPPGAENGAADAKIAD